jgi:hypothetical protein
VLSRLATEDRTEMTRAARVAYLEGFRRKVDPDGRLSEEEREARAHALLRLRMIQLSEASAKARRKAAERLA